MGVKTNRDVNVNSSVKYIFHRKAGRSIIEHSSVFSPDGESVLVSVENQVRVYNIQTGDCVRSLETESHVNELIAIQFPDDDSYNLYGCSDTGCVTTWTWENGAVLRETKLPIPNNMKIITFNLLDNNECFITAAEPKSHFLYLGLYSVKTGELIYEFRDLEVLYYKNMVRVAVGWCNNERFAAITNGTSILFIQNLHKPHMRNEILNSNKIRILSVVAHKAEAALAITDALGRATIYRGNLYNNGNIAKEILHWHFLPATAVCFSTQGSYLYTGGMERVLVKWTSGNLSNKANEKMFIPRLPGMIRFIVTNNTHVAITLSNNSLIIANAQMRVVCTILECGGLSPVARASVTPLVYHQRLGGLLMGGRTGHLQLYSTATDKVLYNIDITGMNNTPPERHNLIPLEIEIVCAAVSGNGSWLVTSEYRNDGITYPEERLKFWALQIKETTPFKLNTCVNLSHGGCKIVALALNVRGEFCVSAGDDQKFRIWKRENTLHSHRKKLSWNCLTACYYSSGIAQFLGHDILNNFKIGQMPPGKGEEYPYLKYIDKKYDIIEKLVNVHKEHTLLSENIVDAGMRKDDANDMSGIAISQDGSLIAAWFGCKLTLWDTHLCNIRTTLSHPMLRPKGIDVKFGNLDAAHYLVCTTKSCVAVWSLLSLTMKWIVHINPTCLAADPLSNKMAVVSSNNDVYVFTPHSSTPILTQKRLLDPETGVFKQCTFGAATGDDIRLYVMRNDSEVYCLEPERSEETRLEVISRRNLPISNFSALLAEQQLSEVQSAAGSDVRQLDTDALANSAVSQFLSAAPHMAPPVDLLGCPMMLHLSGQEQPEATSDIQEDDMKIEEHSSDDEDIDPGELKGQQILSHKAAQLWMSNYEKIKEKRLHRTTEELLDLHGAESIFCINT